MGLRIENSNVSLFISVNERVRTCKRVRESWAGNMASTPLAEGLLGFLAFLCPGGVYGSAHSSRRLLAPSDQGVPASMVSHSQSGLPIPTQGSGRPGVT